jgi:Flp pilus assembly CpaE family ATPase
VTTWGVLASPEVWEVVKPTLDEGDVTVGWVSFRTDEALTLVAVGEIDYLLVEARGDFLTKDLVASADTSRVGVVALVAAAGGEDIANRVGVGHRVRQPEDFTTFIRRETHAVRTTPVTGHRQPGVIIAVWGPTGSPGRTLLATSIAQLLARHNISTLLVDADSRSGAIAPALGLLDEVPGFIASCRLADRDQLTVSDLTRLAHRYEVAGVGCDVLTGVTSGRLHPEVTTENVTEVLDSCRGMWEAIVVDTGSDIASPGQPPRAGEVVASAVLACADEALAVCQATPVGVARFSRVFSDAKSLRPSQPLTVVLNAVETARRSLSDEATCREALRRFAEVTSVVVIPRDTMGARQAEMAGVSLVDADPKSPAVKALGRVVEPWRDQVVARRQRGASPPPTTHAKISQKNPRQGPVSGVWNRVRVLWDQPGALR